jgi:hypothetical protein
MRKVLRGDLQQLTRIRLAEARVLLQRKQACGAYYLTGIAVECAIKACIAKNVKKHEFPERDFGKACYTHDLDALIGLAQLGIKLKTQTAADPSFRVNWSLVKDWKVDSRYDHSITINKARDLYTAVASRTHGVLRWLRQNW